MLRRIAPSLCLLLALALPAAALVQYRAVSEATAGNDKPQQASTRCWVGPDRMRVESPTDLLLVRADRGLVWIADRRTNLYREYTLEGLRKQLAALGPALAAAAPAATGTKEMAGYPAAGYRAITTSPLAQSKESTLTATWVVDLWLTDKLPEAAREYAALNSRLAAANLPLVALRAALVAADPQAPPAVVSYARAACRLSPALAGLAGMPVASTVTGLLLPPGLEQLSPQQQDLLLGTESGAVRLLVVKTQYRDIRIVPDDPSLFELPRGYKRAAG